MKRQKRIKTILFLITSSLLTCTSMVTAVNHTTYTTSPVLVIIGENTESKTSPVEATTVELTTEPVKEESITESTATVEDTEWQGEVLNRYNGTVINTGSRMTE